MQPVENAESHSADDRSNFWSQQVEQTLGEAWQLKNQEIIPQGVCNDLAQGQDYLSVKAEINALATVLMLRTMEPPLTVGILGGWGSGKSFGMHLIRTQLNAIRSQPLRPEQTWGAHQNSSTSLLFPYVGHIYQIEFDAWTFAKSDLWASLMQTIFWELNRQLTLEKQLEQAGIDQLQGGRIWEVLNQMPEEQRQQLLVSHLSQELLQRSAQFLNAGGAIDSTQQVSSSLWDALRDLKDESVQKLDNAKRELAEQKAALRKKLVEIEIEVEEEVKEESKRLAWIPFQRDLKVLIGDAFEEMAKHFETPLDPVLVKDVLEEYRSPFWLSCVQLWHRDRQLVFAFCATLLLALSTPFLLLWLQSLTTPGPLFDRLENLIALIGEAPVVVASVPLMRKLWQGWKKHQQKIEQALQQYQKQVLEQQDKLEQAKQARIEARKIQDAQIAHLEAQVQQQQMVVAEQEQALSLTIEHPSLNDFLDKRVQSDTYGQKLGIVHQAKQDLTELTNRLIVRDQDPVAIKEKKYKLFPRGPARIVLYIDDLDRCPPQRVVEVLEAVQLLLKTQLFLVVLAIDDCYVARALEKVYSGVLQHDSKPSGLDYLEKVIQIPYRMRPIAATVIPQYLRAQLHIRPSDLKQDSEPESGAKSNPILSPISSETAASTYLETLCNLESVAEAVQFTAQEFRLLVDCCRSVDLTPRTGKRLINIYKILQVVWALPHRNPPPEATMRVVLSFLALSSRYPQFMIQVFADIDARLEEQRVNQARGSMVTLTGQELLQLLEQQIPIEDLHQHRKLRRFKADLQGMLGETWQVDRNALDLTRSFSFI